MVPRLRIPLLLVLIAGLTGSPVIAQADPEFAVTMKRAVEEDWAASPIGTIMQRVGERFLGRPYEAGMLDAPAEETLLAPLDRFDCVLFVEVVLAMSRGIVDRDTTYSGFMRRIEEQRYRGGTMNGYCSRLHYFSEWIADNEDRGLVRNITEALGGRVLPKELTFMGSHRASYRQIATDDSLFAGIVRMERDLADLQIHYVPQERIRSTYPSLRAGDILALATNVDGLDVVHTGLVFDSGDGKKGMLHASLTRGVVVSPDIQSYVENNRSQIGIVVARPTDRREGTP